MLTSFRFELFEVQHSYTSRLTSCTCCGGDWWRMERRGRKGHSIECSYLTNPDSPHMIGFSCFLMGCPLPKGALTKSSSSFSGQQDIRLATFAVSITDPPPTAKNPSKLCFRTKETTSSKLICVCVCSRRNVASGESLTVLREGVVCMCVYSEAHQRRQSVLMA